VQYLLTPSGGCFSSQLMARILVVDDSSSVYYHLCKELEVDGHTVDRLSTFAELPAYMSTRDPDLILLDLEMPALSGTAFAQFVRRIQKRPIPIVIHSSLPARSTLAAAEEVGAAGVIAKGSSGAMIRAGVKRCLASQEAHSAH
jgi:two-component system, OmpR family, response regulator